MTDAIEASTPTEKGRSTSIPKDEFATLRDEVDEIKRVVAAIVRDLTKRE
jgi:hypothetical protein